MAIQKDLARDFLLFLLILGNSLSRKDGVLLEQARAIDAVSIPISLPTSQA